MSTGRLSPTACPPVITSIRYTRSRSAPATISLGTIVLSQLSSLAAIRHGLGPPRQEPGRVPRVTCAINQAWNVLLPMPPCPGVRVISPTGMRPSHNQRTGRGRIVDAAVSRTWRLAVDSASSASWSSTDATPPAGKGKCPPDALPWGRRVAGPRQCARHVRRPPGSSPGVFGCQRVDPPHAAVSSPASSAGGA